MAGGLASRLLVVLSLGCALAPAPLCAQSPPVVEVEPVALGDVTPSAEFIGRVEAIQAVDLVARIEGFIQQVAFEDGKEVKAGDLLYVIEPAPYEAALASARAELAGARANLTNAEGNLARQRELVGRQTVSEATFQQAQATRDSAAATVQQAEASVRRAEINLGYTKITAPIAGRIGKSNFVAGSYVAPASGKLARIVQSDPIRVVFSVSDQRLQEIRARAGNPPQEEFFQRFVPSLRLASGAQYTADGQIEFRGNEVDPQTGTVPIWARFKNTDGVLVPGQFVTVVVRPATTQQKPLVPLGAVQQDRDGRFVLLLGNNNVVDVRRIKGGAEIGQNLAVNEGLQGGESLIVAGFQNARPGSTVTPVAANRTEAVAGAGASTGATR